MTNNYRQGHHGEMAELHALEPRVEALRAVSHSATFWRGVRDPGDPGQVIHIHSFPRELLDSDSVLSSRSASRGYRDDESHKHTLFL